MRGVFEPPIDRGAVPVTQRSPCRPSLSLSIATRHLPQAPSLPHSLTPFFCSWPGSPRHNTEAAADAWPDWLIWLWKMPFLSSTYCLRIRSPTALSHTAISFPLVSLLISLFAFPFFPVYISSTLLAWLYYIWYYHSIRVKNNSKTSDWKQGASII